MIDLRKIIGPGLRGKMMYALSFLPDKLYLRLFYFATTGRMIDFGYSKGLCRVMMLLEASKGSKVWVIESIVSNDC